MNNTIIDTPTSSFDNISPNITAKNFGVHHTDISTSESERVYLYALISTGIFANSTIRKLKDYFGTYESAYNCTPSELKMCLNENAAIRFSDKKRRMDPYSAYKRLALKKVAFVMNEDKRFPPLLREIPDSPVAILVNGSLPNPQVPSVAIVGARDCSNYGRNMAHEYASAIASCGIQIISGMASGIDGIAGVAALDAGGSSYAVLGCGPDVCYPRNNQHLFDRLKEHGGLLSEYALGTSSLKWHFPVRNRIISGLCDAVLVIEAKEKSGTLITVDSALEQGKDVYALPGRTCDALSVGCNNLIHQGAGILLNPADFLNNLLSSFYETNRYPNFLSKGNSFSCANKQKIIFSSPEEKMVYKLLDYNPTNIDEILTNINRSTPMTLQTLMSTLTGLCIKGIVENICGTNYRIR